MAKNIFLDISTSLCLSNLYMLLVPYDYENIFGLPGHAHPPYFYCKRSVWSDECRNNVYFPRLTCWRRNANVTAVATECPTGTWSGQIGGGSHRLCWLRGPLSPSKCEYHCVVHLGSEKKQVSGQKCGLSHTKIRYQNTNTDHHI